MADTRLKDFIEFSIDEEIQAARLYSAAAKKAQTREQKTMLEELAETEAGHEKKLKEFQGGKQVGFASLNAVIDLKISDFLVETDISPSSSLQDIFIFAMKKEQKAYELYSMLAGMEKDAAVKKFFESLAAEEKGHKFEFEKQYDAMVLREN